jgi:hypothetical protein
MADNILLDRSKLNNQISGQTHEKTNLRQHQPSGIIRKHVNVICVTFNQKKKKKKKKMPVKLYNRIGTHIANLVFVLDEKKKL